MVYHIMNSNGKVICSTTMYQLEPLDYDVAEHKVRILKLDNNIEKSIGDFRNAANLKFTQIP